MFKNIVIIFIVLLCPLNLMSSEETKEKTSGGVQLVLIKKGSFLMGQKAKNRDYSPPRKVIISSDFWMGKYEITQAQYRKVTGKSPVKNSRRGVGDDLPVYYISWYDAVEFCNLLSKKSGLKPYYKIDKDEPDDENVFPYDNLRWTVETDDSADGFRLPTEAQWEFACRAGTRSIHYWGSSSRWERSGRYSWHMFNTGKQRYKGKRFWWVKFHKVRKGGQKMPNKWGLHEMNGNVSEWCWDRYAWKTYTKMKKKDPSVIEGKYKFRVLRGGSFLDSPKDLTSHRRWPMAAFEKRETAGIRVILPVKKSE